MKHYLEILTDTIQQNRDCPALTDYSRLTGYEGNDYTYGEMYDKMSWLCGLLHNMGLAKGAHVAICGANSANWIVAYLAVAAFKGVSVTILHTQTPDMILQQVRYADTDALFVDSDIWNALEKECVSDIATVIALDDYSVLRGKTSDTGFQDYAYDIDLKSGDIDSLAQICYTSGSTDEPKGVMLPFRSLSNNIECVIGTFPDCSRENIVSVLPFAHIFGLVEEVLAQMYNAHHIILMGNMMTFSTLSDAFQRVRPYMLFSVPLLLEQIHSRTGDGMGQFFGGRMRQVISGGSCLDPKLEKAIVKAGISLTTGYGTTETGPLISHAGIGDYKPHSVGKVVSGMEALYASLQNSGLLT